MRTFMTSLVPVFLILALAQPTLAQTGSSSPNIMDTQQLAPTASTPQTPAPGEALSVFGTRPRASQLQWIGRQGLSHHQADIQAWLQTLH